MQTDTFDNRLVSRDITSLEKKIADDDRITMLQIEILMIRMARFLLKDLYL